MANRKKEVYKPKPMTEGKRNLIVCFDLQTYSISLIWFLLSTSIF